MATHFDVECTRRLHTKVIWSILHDALDDVTKELDLLWLVVCCQFGNIVAVRVDLVAR
jgi:hypothetical protein